MRSSVYTTAVNEVINAIAQSIIDGQTSGQLVSIKPGKTRNSFSLYEYNVIDGWKIRYNFIKIIGSKAVENEYAEIPRVVALTADWHTQASLSHQIMAMVKNLRSEAAATAQVLPFGKYKGQRIDEINDLSYLCWIANNNDVEGWIKTAAKDRALFLGGVMIGQSLIDINDENRYNKNTAGIYHSIEAGEPIEYVAEQNDGNIWSAYRIELPCKAVGHPYYGVCYCLDIEGKAKRAKNMKITIYDYIVEDNVIKVNGFFATK